MEDVTQAELKLNQDLERGIEKLHNKVLVMQRDRNFKTTLELCQHTAEAELAQLAKLKEPVSTLEKFVAATPLGLLSASIPAAVNLLKEIESLSRDLGAAITRGEGMLNWVKTEGVKATKDEVESKLASVQGVSDSLFA